MEPWDGYVLENDIWESKNLVHKQYTPKKHTIRSHRREQVNALARLTKQATAFIQEGHPLLNDGGSRTLHFLAGASNELGRETHPCNYYTSYIKG